MRWSPRVRQRVGRTPLTLNWSRRGFSWSFKLGWLTLNSRGDFSINGPGFFDYRGRWLPRRPRGGTSRGNPADTPRGEWHEVDEVPAPRKPRRSRGKAGAVCGASWRGGPPCTLAPHPADAWHVPDPAQGDPWRANAWTR